MAYRCDGCGEMVEDTPPEGAIGTLIEDAHKRFVVLCSICVPRLIQYVKGGGLRG